MDPRFSQIPTLKVYNAIDDVSNVGNQLVMLGTIEGVPPTSFLGIFGRNCMLQRTDATGAYLMSGTPGAPAWKFIDASSVAAGFVAVLGGSVTWSGSGATLAATVAGVLTSDIVIATVKTKATQASYLARATASAADTITFELSAANTSNDAVISYTVFRAA